MRIRAHGDLLAILFVAAAHSSCGGDAGDSAAGGGADAPAGTGGAGGNGASASAGTGAQGGADTVGPTDHVTAVWVVNDGEKIERDDLAHPAKAANSSWDGQTARLFAGRNEVVALQVVVEAGPAGVAELRVSLPELAQKGGAGHLDYAPPGDDPTDYVGRPIQIFSENYMLVTDPTSASWIVQPNTPAAPQDMVGEKPVQLVPENATVGRGGMPLAIAPRMNQPVWIDVYVARNLPPGTYEGTIRIESDGEVRKIPLELEVLDFTLPDENGLAYMLYYEGSQVEEYQGANLDAQYHRLAHRNRVEFVNAYDRDAVMAGMGRFDGTDFTAAVGYEGPGTAVGNRLVPRSFYGPDPLFEDQSAARSESDDWMTFLASTLPAAKTLLYMPDEPGPSDYSEIQTIADNIHGNPGPGRELPIFVTHGYTSELDGAIDIWCASAPNYDASRAAVERSQGNDMWYYNGNRPYVGSILIDSPATDARMHGWAAFAQTIPTYFYWHVDHWHHNHNAPSGYDKVQNVWANPMTFINDSGEFGNGDGVLVYPGTEILHPEQDRGIKGPISTIQLANLRRGAQDYLYLSLARKCGSSNLVDASLQAIVPKVFSAADATVSFPESGDAYEAARKTLAEALAGCPSANP